MSLTLTPISDTLHFLRLPSNECRPSSSVASHRTLCLMDFLDHVSFSSTLMDWPLTFCWMWEHRADKKEAEGCCIERATASEYIHNQMSKLVTNRVT